MIREKSLWGLVCAYIDGENFAHLYRLHKGHAGLKVIRALFQCIDDYLRNYGLIAGVGCRKVFLARRPPECVEKVFCEFKYEMVLSCYEGKDAADLELIDHVRQVYRIADPRYVKAFLIASSDTIFAGLGWELKPLKFASVCIGSGRSARLLTRPYDEAMRLWCDSFGSRLMRLSAPPFVLEELLTS